MKRKPYDWNYINERHYRMKVTNFEKSLNGLNHTPVNRFVTFRYTFTQRSKTGDVFENQSNILLRIHNFIYKDITGRKKFISCLHLNVMNPSVLYYFSGLE